VSLTYAMADPAQRRRGLDAATSALRRGDLVVLPVDTVYAVACDAFSDRGVDRLREAKAAGPDLPLQVLVGTPATIDGLGYGLTKAARDLAEAFWPGGLTLVVRQQPSLTWDLADAAGTVGLRMPLHPVALELLRATGPLAVSAASRAGALPPGDVESARSHLGAAVTAYLDGGPTLPSAPSTIVDVTGPVPRLLRPGALDADTLRSVCPDLASD
jgi:tRNA threonylcarbamoyl adenosine modification protein (Sua5/YciO/YrdC/YwlC family)